MLSPRTRFTSDFSITVMSGSLSQRHRMVALGLAVVALFAGVVRASEAERVTVKPAEREVVFEGWGTSLCWFGNAVGQWPEAPREAVSDALFSRDGLGLTAVRYNIGGGEAPGHAHMLWFRQMEGFQDEKGAWNWEADHGQRWMLDAAIKRGATNLEAFSNSPPYWMTRSGCASGGTDPNADNLAPEMEKAFAEYLAEVTNHFHKEWGVDFQTLDPFNEPFTNYWKAQGGQEGCHFDHATQRRVIALLRSSLDARGLQAVGISASDETSYEKALGTLETFDEATLAHVSQINAHAYSTEKRMEFRDKVLAVKKPLVMSEVDGGGNAPHDHAGMRPALELAGRIVDDLRDLRPLRWVFWQAVEDEKAQEASNSNWGLIHADLDGRTGKWSLTKKYHALAQFSKFIRPGAKLLVCSDPQAVATYHSGEGVLVLVVRNEGTAPRTLDIDVSEFGIRWGDARVLRTAAGEDVAPLEPLKVVGGKVALEAVPESVTTLVLAARP